LTQLEQDAAQTVKGAGEFDWLSELPAQLNAFSPQRQRAVHVTLRERYVARDSQSLRPQRRTGGSRSRKQGC
jgi:hypothetical protein